MLVITIVFQNGCSVFEEGIFRSTASKGHLDLRSWDPVNDNPADLSGEWEIYWNRLLTPDDFNKTDPVPSYIEVPSPWQGRKIDNELLTPMGYATYRLTIQLNRYDTVLGLYIPNMDNAYRLWVNGSLISTGGYVGTNHDEMKPQRLPLIRLLSTAENNLEMVIQISNFHHRNGGMLHPVLIGSWITINRYHDRGIAWEMFLFGGLSLTGIYHLILSLIRKRELSCLFFGLFCIIIGIRILVSGHYLLVYAFQGINWEFGVKLEYLSFYFGLLFFSLYLYGLFRSIINVLVIRIITIISSLFIITVLVTPAVIYTQYTLIPFQILAVAGGVYYIVFLLRISLKSDREAVFVLCGLLFIFTAMVTDILSSHAVFRLKPLIPFGSCLFIFSQSLLLSIKFTKTYRELDNLSKNLEKKVAKRTTELQAAKDKLEISHNEKMSFFVNLSHEIRTPLMLLSNYMNDYINDHGSHPSLLIMQENIHKLIRDMINFFDILKFEKGMNIYNHENIVDFSRFLTAKLRLFSSFFRKKNIALISDIAPSLYIKADPMSVDRILNNLLENAGKYTKKNGRICVKLHGDTTKVRFSVADTGIGIKEEQLEKIFLPYYQLSHKKRNIQGMGMGLAIINNIIGELKGIITVNSKPGEGSVFLVELPRCSVENTQTPCSDFVETGSGFFILPGDEMPEKNRYDKSNPDLLLVEDNEELLYLMKKNMGHLFNIYSAGNGKEAIAVLEQNPTIQMIVSDIMMDEMNGFELLETVQQIQGFEEVPFIFITAKATIKERNFGIEKGAVDYIFKPFSINELAYKIQALFRYRYLQKKLHQKEKQASLAAMTASIAHEILNPLSGISGPLANLDKQLLQENLVKKDFLFKHINYIRQSVSKIENIIRNVKLIFSEQKLKKENIDIKSLIDSIISKYRESSEKKIKFVLNDFEDLRIHTDRTAFLQIIDNIVSNAVNAIENQGTISISCLKEKDQFIIRIEDNGPGIPDELKPVLFEAFLKGNHNYPGNGLGMFIVKELTAKLNWDIQFESEEGKGTVFLVKIN
ncbi:MAG: response regulator [Spirochaetales bacterium]|nr:response regulator [Spirochaetales bacterium]